MPDPTADIAHASEYINNLNIRANLLEGDDPDEAYRLAEEAYHASINGVFLHAPYEHGQAEALLNMAAISEQRGQHQQSIQQASEALAMFERLNQPRFSTRALYLLGWNYFSLGDYPKGMACAVRQLKIAEETGHQDRQAEAHNLMGALYGEIEEGLAQSIDHYRQSLSIYQALGSSEDEAVLLNNLCVTLTNLERYAEALDYGLQSLAISRQTENIHGEVLALTNLGVVYMHMGDAGNAAGSYTRALELSRQQGFRTLEAHTLLELGKLHSKRGDDALEFFQEALALAEALEHRKWVYDCHYEIALLHERAGRFADALLHYKRYHTIEREVLNEGSRHEVERLKLAYDIGKVESELERERRQRDEDRRYFERISQLKDELINTASHDLKNPLTSILLNLEYLGRFTADAEPRVKTLIERAKQSATHMKAMIHDLLDQAMLETGRGLLFETVSLRPYMEKIVGEMEAHAAQKGITLSLDVPDGNARFDPARIRQMLDNLLSNAIKYTSEGGKVALVVDTAADSLIFHVSDTGIGIPADAIPHLFKPFYRVDTPAHGAVEGTGLGLSIVRTIIDQHNGAVRVHSTEGEGSTFTVTLPQG